MSIIVEPLSAALPATDRVPSSELGPSFDPSLGFGARISGVDLTGVIDEATIETIRRALDDYSVLVFSDQRFEDESQTAFSARFGALEVTIYKPEGDGGVPVANISNVDPRTGEIFPKGHSRLKANSGNEMWHTDSSFKPVPAYCSMLSGREVPPEGGRTEFASCRTAYTRLSEEEQVTLDGRVAVHDYGYSRSLVPGYQAPAKALAEVPPVQHAVVRTNPTHGQKNFYTGSHASHIVGEEIGTGRRRLAELVELATEREFVYSHQWAQFDFVIWDNRCVLHRGTPFDVHAHRRVMRRTTVAGTGPTVDADGHPVPNA